MFIFKFLTLTLFLYFLALAQTSFLAHFNIFGFTINLVFIAVIILNLFENPKKVQGVFYSFLGGFFLDIYSSGLFGFHIIILLAIAILIKFILSHYVRIPSFKRA